MSLDTLMNMSITVADRAPTLANFGVPLLFGYHTRWLDRLTRLYSSPDDMLTDGFTVNDALYKTAVVVKSQKPSPDTFMIGRRVTPLTQLVKLTPKVTTAGYQYKGMIGGKALTYTVLASATTTTVATGIAALIGTLAVGATAVAATGVVTVTTTVPGSVIEYDFTATAEDDLLMEDITVDTTTNNELPLVKKESDLWYGLIIVDSMSKATTLNGAGYTETQRKLFVAETADTVVGDPAVIDDIMSDLQDSAYARTGAIYHRAIDGSRLAAGWLARALTTTPGASSMAFKEVPGVPVDEITTAFDAAILSKNGSYYTQAGGLNLTFEGKSGSGDFMDTTRFLDWVYATMRNAVVGKFASVEKVPFTDDGTDTIIGLIAAVIQQGITAGGFAATPAYTVTAPKVRDVPVANRIARIMPDINWTATLAGAIHRLNPVRGLVAI